MMRLGGDLRLTTEMAESREWVRLYNKCNKYNHNFCLNNGGRFILKEQGRQSLRVGS